MVPKSIGRRISELRQQLGWTQQELAHRAAISRVAVSHIEADLSLPSERTVARLAGLFKLTPFELVAGTTYPSAKAERLPAHVCCHTELDLALMQNDLNRLDRLPVDEHRSELVRETQTRWRPRLQEWEMAATTDHERAIVAGMRRALNERCSTIYRHDAATG